MLGRRITKRVYGTPGYTRFIHHHDHVAFQADSAGSMGLRFTWGLGTDDLRAVTDAAGQHYYIVQDKLGSVRGLFERNGTWRASVRFSPYGDLVAIDSTGPRPAIWHGWTGREFDEETGWFYHRVRYYSPLVRRFVQEDPIGHFGGTNVYAYVEGRALEAKDPNGTAMVAWADAGASLGGGNGAGFGGIPDLESWSTRDPVNNAWMLAFVPKPRTTGEGRSWTPPSRSGGGGGGGGGAYGGTPGTQRRPSLAPDFKPEGCYGDPRPAPFVRVKIGRYTIVFDPGRKGGLGAHFQVYEGKTRLPGIIDAVTGTLKRHAGKEARIPSIVVRELFAKGWIGRMVGGVGGILGGLLLPPGLEAPETPPCAGTTF